jgi:hypothetical protein
MKLVLLMYLEEDEGCVNELLQELEVPVSSRLSMEGMGKGTPGWYGEVAPFASRMAFTMVEDDLARRLLRTVAEGFAELGDPGHPVRAVQLPVEEATACGVDENPETGGAT